MYKINWQQKLSSRKLWALVSALVTVFLVLLKAPEETITQVVALIGAFASIAVYILAEASVDAAREGRVIYEIITEVDEPPDQ